MMTSGGPGPQAIIAFDIGFWFALKDQRLRRIDVGPADRLSVSAVPVPLISRVPLRWWRSEFPFDVSEGDC
ncbi:hypothetical protein, partial [Loktanella fryxellensis]|uniref:hypothetical protein n=1 Tax=Loktanella fryxellensis TaxID=245187 RepID=UPI00115FA1E0